MKSFTKIMAFGVLGLAPILSGCLLPTHSVMPATVLECSVSNAESGKPIAGASLSMIYTGPNGEVVKEGPFHTDENGHSRIEVSKRSISMKGTDAYFAGGYLRHIEVDARGFESTGYWENFDFGLLEKKAPFSFRMQPFRNRFGSVMVVSHTTGSTHILHLKVLDGPNIGERIDLPVMPLGIHGDLTGIKLYLRCSITDIRSDTVKHGILAHNFALLLREGFPNEPYESALK